MAPLAAGLKVHSNTERIQQQHRFNSLALYTYTQRITTPLRRWLVAIATSFHMASPTLPPTTHALPTCGAWLGDVESREMQLCCERYESL